MAYDAQGNLVPVHWARQLATLEDKRRADILCEVLRDVMSATLKDEDAQCSAEAHTDRALVALKRLCSGWTPANDEEKYRMRQAETHMDFYRQEKQEK